MDRIVHHLPGDRASRRTRARTLLRLATALAFALVAGIVLWQFQATKDYASAVFASTAVVAVVIGLAAQGTLSNVVAGIVLAFSQPIRLGDRVSIDGLDGVVEEIGLSYSRLRSDDGTSADWERASAALRERAGEAGLGEVDVVVCDVGPETVTVEVRGRCAGAAQAARAEKQLRAVAAALVGAEHA